MDLAVRSYINYILGLDLSMLSSSLLNNGAVSMFVQEIKAGTPAY